MVVVFVIHIRRVGEEDEQVQVTLPHRCVEGIVDDWGEGRDCERRGREREKGRGEEEREREKGRKGKWRGEGERERESGREKEVTKV